MCFLCCQRRLSPGILAVPEQYQAANYTALPGEDFMAEDGRTIAKVKADRIVSSLKEGLVNPEWPTAHAEHSFK